jgi:hypothetical protein
VYASAHLFLKLFRVALELRQQLNVALELGQQLF